MLCVPWFCTGVKRPGLNGDTHLHLAPILRTSGTILLLPPCAFMYVCNKSAVVSRQYTHTQKLTHFRMYVKRCKSLLRTPTVHAIRNVSVSVLWCSRCSVFSVQCSEVFTMFCVQYSVVFTMFCVHDVLCSVFCGVHDVLCSVFCSVHDVLCSVFCGVHDVLCSVFCGVHDVLCSVFCGVHDVLCSLFCSVHDVLCSVFCGVHDVLCSVFCCVHDVLCSVFCGVHDVLCSVFCGVHDAPKDLQKVEIQLKCCACPTVVN
jgi:hypothetical protein